MQRTQRLQQRAQKGFTLIELIITIVIIGVLAAVAIPKFQSLTGDAEKGVASGVAAALASATSVNYARSKVPGAVACTGTLVLGTTCTYYAITACSSLNAAAIAALADVPTGYAVSATDVTAVASGTSAGVCSITKGGTATGVNFNVYGT